MKIPTNALVAVAWAGQRVTGITPAMVATRLPRGTEANPYPWRDLGFVQMTPITGTPDVDLDVRHPLVQVDCWAMNPDTTNPPIGKANNLAELVRTATHSPAAPYSSPLAMPTGYAPAILLSAYALTEPVEVADDPSGYARVTFDLALDWALA